MYYTLQDVTNKILEAHAPSDLSTIIRELIDEHEKSTEKAEMDEGVSYYGGDQDIDDIDFTEYTDRNGQTKHQTNKANNHLTHPFYRLQTLEKVAYLLKSPLTITYEDDNKAKAEQVIEDFKAILGSDFNDFLIDVATAASNKGYEFIHPYIKDKKFKYIIIEAEECIPVYETKHQQELVELIRYFKIDVDESGVKQERYKIEWYTTETVTIYQENKRGIFELEDEQPHLMIFNAGNREATEKNSSWGRVPFIFVKNNTGMYPDLRFVKSLIDDYDKGASDFSNNLEDIQEAIWIAAGTGEDPGDLRDKLKKYRMVCTSEPEAKITKETIDIPFEARKEHMETLEDDIDTSGMSLNPKNTEIGITSGVALMWLYKPLDLKAGLLERKLDKALHELFWFIGEFLRITEKKEVEIDKFKFTFNKTMISNEAEKIESVGKSKGIISDETLLANHPFVTDVEREKKLIEADREAQGVVDLDTGVE